MRRLIILLLLCVLQLQFALAAGADARFHAGGGEHHQGASHSHSAASDIGSDSIETDESSARTSGDCNVCHFAHLPMMLGSGATGTGLPREACDELSLRDQHCTKTSTERPERPNWSHLV